MNEKELQKSHNIYPRDSKKYSDERFVKIDNGGTHWTCFHKKDNKSLYLTRLADSLINVYPVNYQNKELIIVIKFKKNIVDCAEHNVHSFST